MQKTFNTQPLDRRCMSTVQLLTEIEMLAHTDYMTGTLNSGIPYLDRGAVPTSTPSGSQFAQLLAPVLLLTIRQICVYHCPTIRANIQQEPCRLHEQEHEFDR